MDFLLFLYLKPEKETGKIKSPLLDKGAFICHMNVVCAVLQTTFKAYCHARHRRENHNPNKDMERRIHQADRREENALSEVSCIEKGSERSQENQKEHLQHLAAGTVGTTAPHKAGCGAITDRAAG